MAIELDHSIKVVLEVPEQPEEKVLTPEMAEMKKNMELAQILLQGLHCGAPWQERPAGSSQGPRVHLPVTRPLLFDN